MSLLSSLPSLATLTQPGREDRRGAHPRFRALIDAGPEALESELRSYLQTAPPEAVAENPRAAWQTALEVLDVPRNAAVTLINTIFGSPIRPTSKEEFAGLRKIYGADLLQAMGWRPDSTIGKVGQFLAGLMLDFAVDPLTWLPGLGLARGTVRAATAAAGDVGRGVAAARQAAKGLTLAPQLDAAGQVIRESIHVRPQALGRIEQAAAAGEPALEEAIGRLGREDLYRGRWGVGLGTHQARTTPLGHLVLGPPILGAQALGALTAGGGRLARAGLKRIPYLGEALARGVARPIEMAGRGLTRAAESVGALSDRIGTPLSLLPEVNAFAPLAEIPVIGPALNRVGEALSASPTVRRLGEAAVELGSKVGLGPGTPLSRLIQQYREQAEQAVRGEDAHFARTIEPALAAAAKQTGIAADDLDAVVPALIEYQPLIETAARIGDAAQLRRLLDAQEEVVADLLGARYRPDKVRRTTDAIMAEWRRTAGIDSATFPGRRPPDPVPTAGPTPELPAAAADSTPAVDLGSVPVYDLDMPGAGTGPRSAGHRLAYKHGISGSRAEAVAYVESAARPLPDVAAALKRTNLRDEPATAPVILVPIPSTSGSDNQVPLALAEHLAESLNAQVRADLLTAGTQRSRRSQNRLESLVNGRDFVAAEMAELPDAARILVVDDVYRTGGTARDAVEALRQAGYPVEAVVSGKVIKGGPRTLAPTATQRADLARRVGDRAGPLVEVIGRPLDTLTAREVQTLLDELARPGASPEALARTLGVLREAPRSVTGTAPARERLYRRQVQDRLVRAYDDLIGAGLLDEAASRNAIDRASQATDAVETPHAAGYTFTPAMAGEARGLRENLRARGYGRLAGRVKVSGDRGAALRGASGGDDAYVDLRDAGHPDPLEAMAQSIILHDLESSPTARARKAAETIEANPELASPEQKDLARRWRALTSTDADVRRVARGMAPQEVAAESLAVGDRVRIAGDPHTVVERRPDGSMRVRDGADIDIQPGEPLVIDAGSHQPDPVGSAVSAAVGELRAAGSRVTVDRVLGVIRERAGEGPIRDARIKEVFGLTTTKGQLPRIKSAIEAELLRAGQGVRGLGWEAMLARLEHAEQWRPGRQGIAGRAMARIETETHPQGALIRSSPGTEERPPGAPELTDLGRQALVAMRAHLAAVQDQVAAGRGNQHVADLVERIIELRARAAAAKRSGQTRPPAIWRELRLKEGILQRMGVSIEDDIARRAAAAAANSREEVGRVFTGAGVETAAPLPVPAPRDLFAPEIAEVVERFLTLETRTRAAEAAKGVGAADLSRTTERGLGYFPRLMGTPKSMIGQKQRTWGKRWAAAWALRGDLEAPTGPAPKAGSAYADLVAAIERENTARHRRGQASIPVPAPEDDLTLSVGRILDEHPDLMPRHRHQLRRTFLRESMLHEVNALAEHTGMAFITDPVVAWKQRRYASHFAQAGADFLAAVIRDAHKTGLARKGPTPEGYARITDPRFGALAKGWAFTEDLVREFNRFQRTMDRPGPILGAWDWASSQWKTMVLGVMPYTTTNLLSGVFQANQQDAFSHRAWSAARRWMEDVHQGRNLAAPMSRYLPDLPREYGRLTAQDFYEGLAIEHGALGKGLHGVELEAVVGEGYRSGWGVQQALSDSVADAGFWPKVMRAAIGLGRNDRGQLRLRLGDAAYFRAFRAVNVAVEDWMKAGFILERLRRGDDLTAAAQKGRLALNQSADLTQFERDTFRRVLPFYGWMKGNAVLQFMMAVDRPAITALVPKIRGNLEASLAGEETLPPSLRPRHVAGELGTQVTGGPRPDFLNLTRLYPVRELGTTPLAGPVGMARNLVDSAIQGLNPLAKMPVEAALNRDLFWDRPITEYEGQKKRFLGIELSPGTKRLVQMLRPLNVAEQVGWRGVPASAGEAAAGAGQALGLRMFGVDVGRQVLDARRLIDQNLAAVMRDYSRARVQAERARRDWRSDPDVRRMAEIYQRLIERRGQLPLEALREADRERAGAARTQRRELRDYAAAS